MVANSMEGLVKNVPTVLRSSWRPMVSPRAFSVTKKLARLRLSIKTMLSPLSSMSSGESARRGVGVRGCETLPTRLALFERLGPAPIVPSRQAFPILPRRRVLKRRLRQ